MALLKLQIPPGFFRNGTEYQSMGRWYDGNGIRFTEGTKRPIGGWRAVADGTTASTQITFSGSARAALAWQANDGQNYLAVGTHTKLYTFSEGSLNDATYLGAKATSVLTFTGTPSNTQTVTIGARVYTFQTTLTDSNGNVLIDGLAGSLNNLTAAIDLDAGAGTTYATSTVAHPDVDSDSPGTDTMTITAEDFGTTANAITTTTTVTVGSWTAGTMAGGVNAFTTGQASTTYDVGGYGIGGYGVAGYGGLGATIATRTEAAVWCLDTFGEDVVAVCKSDGRVYYWDRSSGGDASPLTNAPTSCAGVVVTPERFIVALGAGGVPRAIQWASQETTTTWTAASTNTAGDFILEGRGELMCGRRARNETLLWTDEALWAMRYIGGTLVYSVVPLGNNCGIIGRNAVAIVGGAQAFWMGRGGFFTYDGFVKPIPCEVSDHVFGNLHEQQREKVVASSRARYGEIWWFYPTSTEIDRYVVYNYREGFWTFGTLVRLADIDQTPFDNPMAIDSSGNLWEHEVGTTRTGMTPYLQSGPYELGDGTALQQILSVYPDLSAIGALEATFYTRMYPTATSTSQTVTLANPTDVRLTGRQVSVKLTELTATDWRLGDMRVETTPAGQR
jgi:hypothetical protein